MYTSIIMMNNSIGNHFGEHSGSELKHLTLILPVPPPEKGSSIELNIQILWGWIAYEQSMNMIESI